MTTVCVTLGGGVYKNVVVVVGVGMLRHEQTLEEYGADWVAGMQPLTCRGRKIRLLTGALVSSLIKGISCMVSYHMVQLFWKTVHSGAGQNVKAIYTNVIQPGGLPPSLRF